MSQPHIPLEQRKRLAVHLTTLPLLQQHEFRLLQAGAEAHLRMLREHIRFLATKAASFSRSERLDANLKTLAEELRAGASFALSGQFGQLFSPLVTQLTAQMTQLSCSACSSIPNVVCDGGTNDDVLVAAGGHCIKLLQDLFDVALDISKQAFQHHLPNLPLPAVEFSTAHYNGKPHDVPVPFYCGGKTMFDSSGSSVVQLHLTPAELDWDTCLASLYVLVHECFCHAFYGARNPSRREETGNDDPFTEGWMDWLAHELLVEKLSLISALPASSSDFARITTIFSEKRCQYRFQSSEPPSKHAKMYALGKSAVKNMLRLLERLPESQADPRRALFRFSCDVLAEGFSLDQHEHLVWSMNLWLPSPGELDNPKQFERVPQSTRIYLKSNDINQFVYALP